MDYVLKTVYISNILSEMNKYSEDKILFRILRNLTFALL